MSGSFFTKPVCYYPLPLVYTHPLAPVDHLRPAWASAAPFFPLFPRSWTRSKRLHVQPVVAAFSQEPHRSSSSSSSSSSFVCSALSSRIRAVLLFIIFVTAISGVRSLFLGVLPTDFSDRWRRLIAFAEEAEFDGPEIPEHLAHAIVATEDHRFFRHVGVDPVALARAVVHFPRSGGGSTITQQLVKNVFLKSERKMSRKLVEMCLALILERKMSKQRILYSYMSKVYWGHGKYGIRSASIFYFGKQPSFLSVGESAMLAGMLPAPEIFSPFKHESRGKLAQARALRKMVEAGFIDMEHALSVASQTLYFQDESEKVSRYSRRRPRKSCVVDEIWDWEGASRAWEAREYLESWATSKHNQRNSPPKC